MWAFYRTPAGQGTRRVIEQSIHGWMTDHTVAVESRDGILGMATGLSHGVWHTPRLG
jgi:hypothetical protein